MFTKAFYTYVISMPGYIRSVKVYGNEILNIYDFDARETEGTSEVEFRAFVGEDSTVFLANTGSKAVDAVDDTPRFRDVEFDATEGAIYLERDALIARSGVVEVYFLSTEGAVKGDFFKIVTLDVFDGFAEFGTDFDRGSVGTISGFIYVLAFKIATAVNGEETVMFLME